MPSADDDDDDDVFQSEIQTYFDSQEKSYATISAVCDAQPYRCL